MRIILERMQDFLPELNKQSITWNMVECACIKVDVNLICLPLRMDGYFIPAILPKRSKPEIYVNANLSESLQIATAVHELKHAIFDTDSNSILCSQRQEWSVAVRSAVLGHQKRELEACAMGAIALIDAIKLQNATRGLFDEGDEFLMRIWQIRRRICEVYGI